MAFVVVGRVAETSQRHWMVLTTVKTMFSAAEPTFSERGYCCTRSDGRLLYTEDAENAVLRRPRGLHFVESKIR